MSFKDVFLALLFSITNILCTFHRGHYWEYIFEIIFNLDQLIRSLYRLKILSIFSSGEHLIQWSRMICVFLEEGIIKSI